MSKKSQFEKHRARPELDAHPALLTEDGRVCYLDGDQTQTFICVPDAEYENITRIDITYFLNLAYMAGNKLALGVPAEKINMVIQGFAMDSRVHYNNELDRQEGKETPSLSERRGN